MIAGQRARVRARFPGTAPAELKLLPAARRNPDGRRPMTIDMLEGPHREWADRLGLLRTRDGAEFNRTKIVPYAYRHTYAQRHARQRRERHSQLRGAGPDPADPVSGASDPFSRSALSEARREPSRSNGGTPRS